MCLSSAVRVAGALAVLHVKTHVLPDFPPLVHSRSDYPASAAGDRGFDPLRLGANQEALAWYREAELYNARFAMMAVVGILFTDAVGLPKWWLAGAEVRLVRLFVL